MKRTAFILSILCVLCLAPATMAQDFPLPPSADLALQNVEMTTPANVIPSGRATSAFDDFNRADNPSMGPDWTEMVGGIDILNNEAYESAGTLSWMLHTSGADNYDTTMIEFDIDPNASGDSLYAAAVIGYDAGTGEDIFVKVQNQTGLPGYSHYGFYHAHGAGGYGSWGGFGTLPNQINGGHVIVYIDNAGDRVNLDIDETPVDGIVDYHFEAAGLIASGLPTLLGTGTGAGFWSNGTMDNWTLNGGTSTPSVDIKCNGADAGVQVPAGTNAKLDFDVVASTAAGTPVDIWLVRPVPFVIMSPSLRLSGTEG